MGTPEVGKLDELRSAVWDFLYRSQESKTIEQIAAEMGQSTDTIRAIVEHEWFTIVEDLVSIKQSPESNVSSN